MKEAKWIVAMLLVAACTESSDVELGPKPGDTGVTVQALIGDGTDVDSSRFDVTKVSCADGTPLGGPLSRLIKIAENRFVSRNVPDLPLDGESKHLFADFFVLLDPGCYNVEATPVTLGGLPSVDCVRAFKNNVSVTPGQTTEVILINQCKHVDRGARDTITVLNHGPEITNVEFSTSKFTCKPVEVCVDGRDPEDDPVEFTLTGPDCSVVPTTTTPGRQCWQVACSTVGKHELKATIFDRLHDLQRIEDWLTMEGYPSPSRSSLDFWVYWTECKCENPWVCDGEHTLSVCEECAAGGQAYCFKRDDDTGICIDDFRCGGKPKCKSEADCGDNQVCIVDSCCDEPGSGVGTCAPIKLMCTLDDPQPHLRSLSGEGSTATQR